MQIIHWAHCLFSNYILLLNRGYTAPEYAIQGQLTEKVDTYSFGIVILEIISGRKINDTRLEPEAQYLLESVSIFLLKNLSWFHILPHMACIFYITTSHIFDSFLCVYFFILALPNLVIRNYECPGWFSLYDWRFNKQLTKFLLSKHRLVYMLPQNQSSPRLTSTVIF